MPTYEEIVELVNNKNYDSFTNGIVLKKCVLLTKKEDLPKESVNVNFVINIISLCSHETNVTISNFKNKNTGVLCNKCINRVRSEKSKNIIKNNDVAKGHEIEKDSIVIFKKLVERDFDILETTEGCLADLIIKPKEIQENRWLKLQFKSTEKLCYNQYCFHIDNKIYTNCIMVFICTTEEKVWIIPFDELDDLSSLRIGLTNKSKYNKYLTTEETIVPIIKNHYSITQHFNKEVAVEPQSIDQKTEYKYRLLREQKLNFINFTSPQMNNMVYDFLIGNKKFQEKVVSKRLDKNGFSVGLFRRIGNNNYGYYKLGDNDFYWIWCNGTNIFYVIPENIMLENDLIATFYKTGTSNLTLYPERSLEKLDAKQIKSRWTFEYKFDLDNLDKEKLLNLLNISET